MIHDVIIIGAGPCGLAVAARLREPTPAALFTDAEHARYWRRFDRVHTLESEARQQKKKAKNSRHNLESGNATPSSISENKEKRSRKHSRSLLVLDAESDEWLTRWRSRFDSLRISHLRSPLFFHCDPRDRDGLLEFSHVEGRAGDLDEIANVVGKEVSKHRKKSKKGKSAAGQRAITRHLNLDNRDQIDYQTPSSTLFSDYCSCLVHRYDLESVVQKATVTSVSYGTTSMSTESDDLFTLHTDSGQVFFARSVVVAIGPASVPSIPSDHSFLDSGSANHLFTNCPLLPSHIISRLSSHQDTSIAVIGGGLSSAQIATLLIHQYSITKVYLILRSSLKIKHFDVDLEWVSKLRNANMASFWSADSDHERFEMLRDARGGGSVPPKWAKFLRRLENEKRLECLERSKMVAGQWDDDAKLWNLVIETASPHAKAGTERIVTKRTLTGIDHIICATGLSPRIEKVQFLSDLNATHPIESISGLPRINEDLMWNDEIPLFFTGALAGLRLGPGAGNLAGARLGAERVAWGIDNVLGPASEIYATAKLEANLGKRKGSDTDSAYASGMASDHELGSEDDFKIDGAGNDLMTDRSEFTGGFRNQFETLAI